jgi:hypothetical protein
MDNGQPKSKPKRQTESTQTKINMHHGEPKAQGGCLVACGLWPVM